MTAFPGRFGAGCRLIIMAGVVLAMAASPIASGPFAARAQHALAPGAMGMVANSSGEPVLLRETPSFDAAVVTSYPVGTPATITEGPVYGADGTPWLGITAGGFTGYMVAGNLVAGDPGTTPAPAPATLAAEPDMAPTPADAVPAEAALAAPQPVPTGDPAGAANPVTTADLNLRAGPGYEEPVLAVIPAGAMVVPTGEWLNQFAGVTFQGQYGWVDSAWLGSAAPATAAPAPEVAPAVTPQDAAPAPAPVDANASGSDPAAPAGAAAYTTAPVNLRMGPSEGDEVLRVVPAGAGVTVTGETLQGWTPVWYGGAWGFISANLLQETATGISLAQDAIPAASLTTSEADAGTGELLATTLSDVNLRSAPDGASPVVTTIPAGAELTPLSGPEAGYYQVEFNGQTGWVASEYLQVSASYLQRGKENKNKRKRKNQGKVEESEPATNAEARGGGIIWPVSGGTWSIMQGYNGSSHQNQDDLWQYYYSLDLVRENGNTAGQTVMSPVNGVVRWTDPGSGGISIDMGDGYAVAMFHVNFDRGIEAGTELTQGQAIGKISGPGGPGFSGMAHLHFTLWTSDDNGNWDREAVPFTGKYAISGMSFPDTGGRSQHAGTTFTP